MGLIKSVALSGTKSHELSLSDSAAHWYGRHGFYRLASSYGQRSHAGRSITPLSALEASAVYACVKIIAEDMGNLPFFTFARSRDRSEVEKAFSHRLWPVLKNLFNPDLAAGEGVEALTAHAALIGDGFARIQRFGRNQLFLWPLDPQLVRVEKDIRGRAVYIVRESPSDPEKEVRKEDIFHLRGFTLSGVAGDDLLRRARHVIGLTLSSQEFAGSYFANDLSAGLFIEHPGDPGVPGVKAMKEAFKEAQGPSHAGEPFILREGAKANRVDPDLSKMQLIEVRKFQILEACRIWRMPPHKLAQLEDVNKANVETQSIEYVQHTLKPWARRWKEAVHRCLLNRDEQMEDRIFAEHDLEAIVRGDFKTQSDGFAKMLEKGVWSVNEVRRFLNANPVEGGDKHHIQLNMGELGKLSEEIVKELEVEVIDSKPRRRSASEDVRERLRMLSNGDA